MTPKFYGQVSKAGILNLRQPVQFREHLKTLAGKQVELVVRRLRNKRSIEQNAWIWGVAYPLLAETLGYDKDEREMLHYALVAKCFGTHYDELLKADVPNRRSSRLSTAQFSEYMEWLVRFAAKEFDCQIPLPDEAEVSR